VPDLVLVASQDGWNHLRATGMFGRCGADTRILLEAGLEDPPAAGRIWRLPLRSEAGGKRAALAGLAAWATCTGALSGTAWERALDALGEERRRLHESGVQTGHELGARETGAPW
jgi:hypothetical protein